MVLPYGLDIILSAVLLCFSAMFSGLNLGVLSLQRLPRRLLQRARPAAARVTVRAATRRARTAPWASSPWKT